MDKTLVPERILSWGGESKREKLLHYRFIYSHVDDDDDAAGDCETVKCREKKQ